jgi:hypothetical protein
MAHQIAERDSHEDPLASLREAISFSSMDWGGARDTAWIYGIVLGWDGDPDDDPDEEVDAMTELAQKFGWSEAAVERLRRLHAAFRRLDGEQS